MLMLRLSLSPRASLFTMTGITSLLALAACGPGGLVTGTDPDPEENLPPASYDAKLPEDDNDGVAAEQDFCPNTDEGANVDAHGCAANQDIAQALVPDQLEVADIDGDGVSTKTEGMLSQPPPSRVRQRGFVGFVAARTQAGPVVLFAHESSVSEDDDDTYDVEGDVAVASADGFLIMTDADLRVNLNDVGDVRGITGVANVPLPEFGLLGGAGVSGFSQAVVGLGRGNVLADAFDAPLDRGRDYLYFNLQASCAITIADFELGKDAPGATVIYDPTDPFLFMRGELVGLGSLGPLEDVGVGMSFGGHIPWEAEVGPERFEKFDGHVYLEGLLGISAIPVEFEGEGVMRLPDGNLNTTDSQLGVNGTTLLVHELFGVFKLDLELLDSTATVEQGLDTKATFVGVPSSNFLTEGPIRDNASIIEGVISTKVEESYLEGTGDFELDGVWLTSHTPFVVADIPLVNVTFRVDPTGATLTGRVDLVPELPGVALSAGVEAEVVIPANGQGYTILFRGDAEVDGVFTADAVIGLGPGGVTIGADFDTGD
jgi:hypothetical protein